MTADRQRRAACIVQSGGGEIGYPADLFRKGQEGQVVMRLHFADPALAPEVEVLDDGGSPLFVKATRSHVDGMRMPCVGSDPVDVLSTFSFGIEGNRVVPAKLGELDMAGFAKMIGRVPHDPAYFDTMRMGCPFDARLTLRQPFAPNQAEVVGDEAPARRAFLDWLGAQAIPMAPANHGRLFGHFLVIHVPCAKVDLYPAAIIAAGAPQHRKFPRGNSRQADFVPALRRIPLLRTRETST